MKKKWTQIIAAALLISVVLTGCSKGNAKSKEKGLVTLSDPLGWQSETQVPKQTMADVKKERPSNILNDENGSKYLVTMDWNGRTSMLHYEFDDKGKCYYTSVTIEETFKTSQLSYFLEILEDAKKYMDQVPSQTYYFDKDYNRVSFNLDDLSEDFVDKSVQAEVDKGDSIGESVSFLVMFEHEGLRCTYSYYIYRTTEPGDDRITIAMHYSDAE